MKNEKAIVLFSGGQDSTTCLFWAKQRFSEVEAVCFHYGQRHQKEVEVAKEIAEKSNTPITIIEATIISQLAPNALTHHEIKVDKEKKEDELPNTFVPGRNMMFLTFVGAIAYAKKVKHIVTGVSEADYSGYPDCREEFIQSVNQTLNLAMESNFVIHTPLMFLNKMEVWKLSDELGVLDVVKNETLTCYNGIVAEGCGECPACKLREKGLAEYLKVKSL